MPLLRRAFGIDAKAHFFAGCKSFRFILFQLGEGIEDNMVANGYNFFHFIFTIGRGKDVIFFAHFLVT
ncbi:hypothetical protein D3C73_1245830 [compost metagenome]